MELDVQPDEASLAEATAQLLATELRAAVEVRGIAHLALSGGSTPEPVYQRLAQLELPWGSVHVWFGDERAVPPGDPASNYALARRTLLDRAAVPVSNVHRMMGELDPAEAALQYAAELAHWCPPGQTPVLDVVLLGMGDDGHCASLFPHTAALDVRMAWVVANEAPVAPRKRITLTYAVLDAARHVVFLVAGAGKAAMLHEVLEGPPDHRRLPSQAVAPAGRLTWLVDSAAASLLGSPT